LVLPNLGGIAFFLFVFGTWARPLGAVHPLSGPDFIAFGKWLELVLPEALTEISKSPSV